MKGKKIRRKPRCKDMYGVGAQDTGAGELQDGHGRVTHNYDGSVRNEKSIGLS